MGCSSYSQDLPLENERKLADPDDAPLASSPSTEQEQVF